MEKQEARAERKKSRQDYQARRKGLHNKAGSSSAAPQASTAPKGMATEADTDRFLGQQDAVAKKKKLDTDYAESKKAFSDMAKEISAEDEFRFDDETGSAPSTFADKGGFEYRALPGGGYEIVKAPEGSGVQAGLKITNPESAAFKSIDSLAKGTGSLWKAKDPAKDVSLAAPSPDAMSSTPLKPKPTPGPTGAIDSDELADWAMNPEQYLPGEGEQGPMPLAPEGLGSRALDDEAILASAADAARMAKERETHVPMNPEDKPKYAGTTSDREDNLRRLRAMYKAEGIETADQKLAASEKERRKSILDEYRDDLVDESGTPKAGRFPVDSEFYKPEDRLGAPAADPMGRGRAVETALQKQQLMDSLSGRPDDQAFAAQFLAGKQGEELVEAMRKVQAAMFGQYDVGPQLPQAERA